MNVEQQGPLNVKKKYDDDNEDGRTKCSTMMTSMGPSDLKRFFCYIYMFMFDAIVCDNKRKLTIPLKMCNTMRSTSV